MTYPAGNGRIGGRLEIEWDRPRALTTLLFVRMTKALALATPTQGDIETDAAKIRELILQRIRDGESLRSICKDKAMPARSTVHLWLANIEGFSDQYARACEIRADVYADQLLEIADDASRDWVTKKNPD